MKNLSTFEAGYCWSITQGYANNTFVKYVVEDDDPTPGAIGIKTKLKKYYENIGIASDLDGLTDPLDLFASPRMYPVMALYIANRLKWDLYRRYCVNVTPETSPPEDDPWFIVGNDTIGPERGQSLDINIDEGATIRLNHFYDLRTTFPEKINFDLNDIVKEIMIQILDKNFINMVAHAKNW
jgi:hypothetical protein